MTILYWSRLKKEEKKTQAWDAEIKQVRAFPSLKMSQEKFLSLHFFFVRVGVDDTGTDSVVKTAILMMVSVLQPGKLLHVN